MQVRQCSQLGRLFFRNGVAQEITASNLGSGQVFEQVRFSQRRMKLDVKVKAAMVSTVSRRLVKRHDVRKAHAPQVVELDQDTLQGIGEIDNFSVAERRDVRPGRFRRLLRVRLPGDP